MSKFALLTAVIASFAFGACATQKSCPHSTASKCPQSKCSAQDHEKCCAKKTSCTKKK